METINLVFFLTAAVNHSSRGTIFRLEEHVPFIVIFIVFLIVFDMIGVFLFASNCRSLQICHPNCIHVTLR